MINLAVTGIALGHLYFAAQLACLAIGETDHKRGSKVSSYLRDKERAPCIVSNGVIVIGLGTLGIAAWRFIMGSGGSSVANPQVQANLLNRFQLENFTSAKAQLWTLPAIQNLSPEITANSNYYKVSKNFLSDPTVNGTSWKLTVDGLVSQPIR